MTTITETETGASDVTDPESAILASDRNAGPTMRLRDWAMTGTVYITDGMVSDKYRIAPAKAFATQGKADVDGLANGTYDVATQKADPVLVHEGAPNMSTIVADAFTSCTIRLSPVRLHNSDVWLKPTVHDVAPTALLVTADGVEVGLNSAYLADLLDDAEEETGQPLPKYWAGLTKVVRYEIRCGPNPLKPVLVERVAHSQYTKANGGGNVPTVSGRWQAIIMPVKLPE